MIKTFSDLDIYKRSKSLFVQLEQVVKNFPKDSQYLKNQLLRSANSIHSNIAEGFGRSEAEFKQYLTRSLGSNNETLSHLEDACSSRYITVNSFKALFDGYTVLGKQVFRLREKWKNFS